MTVVKNINENKPFGWCVIGSGRIASTVFNEITATGRHRAVSVYSRTLKKAERFAARFGGVAYADLTDALTAPGVEGVYIATPHSAHYPYILKCVAARVPVLCEKAFTVNAAQAKAAIEAAEKRGVYLAEAMWTRFNPAVKQIVDWIREGKIGEIKSITANFCLPLSVTRPFVSERVYLPRYAGGALLDLGVYPVAYAHLLLGVPENVRCESVLKGGVDYDDKIKLTYKNAECALNCSFSKLLTYKSVIIGTKGKIVSPMFYKPDSATLINADGRKTARCKRGYIYEFDGVAQDIRSGKKENALISHKDTLEIMSVLDACRAQARLIYPSEIEEL